VSLSATVMAVEGVALQSVGKNSHTHDKSEGFYFRIRAFFFNLYITYMCNIITMISKEIINTNRIDRIQQYINTHELYCSANYDNILDLFIRYCEDSCFSIDDIHDGLVDLDIDRDTIIEIIDLI